MYPAVTSLFHLVVNESLDRVRRDIEAFRNGDIGSSKIVQCKSHLRCGDDFACLFLHLDQRPAPGLTRKHVTAVQP